MKNQTFISIQNLPRNYEHITSASLWSHLPRYELSDCVENIPKDSDTWNFDIDKAPFPFARELIRCIPPQDLSITPTIWELAIALTDLDLFAEVLIKAFPYESKGTFTTFKSCIKFLRLEFVKYKRIKPSKRHPYHRIILYVDVNEATHYKLPYSAVAVHFVEKAFQANKFLDHDGSEFAFIAHHPSVKINKKGKA